MATYTEGHMLKIFIGESEMYNHETLYHAIILKLKEYGVSGATTLRGIEGFGQNNRRSHKPLHMLSGDLPIVIEVIDTPERIDAILEVIQPMVKEGMIARIHNVEIIHSDSSI
ncbi:DUF190 domain-containing protein [Alkalibacter rhizosphaerae]|uniref:DUF190 domain-containing protein n=1 Tax=Alkalibacter rhizosphaerae TaxID=2815577 RepID=A0A974XDY3_9FIRM|nr:DUF190 domain-containing protein [Alkalibacter rhizosphaerae]QSX07961.1 DUF190 domain-containing protein [Alkalibacter rhizosphaerae]